jgi:hypothetical protein
VTKGLKVTIERTTPTYPILSTDTGSDAPPDTGRRKNDDGRGIQGKDRGSQNVTQKAGRYSYQDAYGNEIRGWRVLYLGV